jgi:phosphoribosylglycinamide formyltransferase-1
MTDEFICDPLTPVGGALDAARMAAGEPGLPGQFTWRGKAFDVVAVLRSWRETGPCTHGSAERYVKKHWFEIETPLGTMSIYFERQSRGGSNRARWFLYSLRERQSEVRLVHSPAPAGTSTPKS